MKFHVENKVAASFAAAFVVLGLVGFVTYAVTTRLVENDPRVANTQQILVELQDLKLDIDDAETGQRGFLLTGRERYLKPYEDAVASLSRHLKRLDALTSKDPQQTELMKKLGALTAQKLGELADTIDVRRHAGFEAAVKIVMTDVGQQTMEEIRDTVGAMHQRASQVLQDVTRRAEARRRRGLIEFGGLTILNFSLLLAAFVVINRYAAERRRAQLAIAEQLDFTKAVTEHLGEGLYTLDVNGLVVMMNPAAEEMLGWNLSDLVGRNMHDVIHYQTSARVPMPADQCPLLKVITTGVQYSTEDDVFWRKDGTPLPVSYTSSPLRKGGEISGAVLAFRDMTERRRVQEELRAAKEAAEASNRTKSLFLANMSHELRTPLNAIIGYSEMLLEDAGTQSQQALDLAKIRDAGKQLLSLINDILDLSKVEAGKMGLYLETFDVGEMIQEIAATMKPMVATSGNTFTVDAAPNAGRMRADRGKLRQCVFNLLSNALKFTRQGKVTLQVRRLEQAETTQIAISVTDTGVGMTADQVRGLFQAFAQADSSTSSKYGGTGLGLAISRQFARMMGGDIVVESELGKGTTFTLTIPADGAAAEAPPPERSVAAPAPAPEPAGDRPRRDILIIDDDDAARDLLERSLTAAGFSVRTAASGEEGLNQARVRAPSAITLDVLMPGLDGWAVLTQLKNDPSLADVPVIMLSIADHGRDMGVALGAVDFLTKPIDRDRLVRVLSRQFIKDAGPVLVVEDDPAAQDMIRRTLSARGWDVLEAGDGREAVQILAKQIPALIVLDLMMPNMDGFEFAAALRGNEAWKAIPVIVLTAKELTIEERERLNGGVQQILAKGDGSRDALIKEICGILGSTEAD